jgi:hypothetical protein
MKSRQIARHGVLGRSGLNELRAWPKGLRVYT